MGGYATLDIRGICAETALAHQAFLREEGGPLAVEGARESGRFPHSPCLRTLLQSPSAPAPSAGSLTLRSRFGILFSGLDPSLTLKDDSRVDAVCKDVILKHFGGSTKQQIQSKALPPLCKGRGTTKWWKGCLRETLLCKLCSFSQEQPFRLFAKAKRHLPLHRGGYASLNVCFSLLALRSFGRQASLKNDSAVVAVHKYVVSQTPTPADHPRTERSEGSRQEYGAGHACFSIFVFDISLPFLYSTPYLTPPLYSIPLPWRLSSANSPRYISPFAVVYLPQP